MWRTSQAAKGAMAMIHTVTGMVVRWANYGEANRMLTVLTREMGKISVGAVGCRKPKSRLASGAQLFFYGRLMVRESKGRSYLASVEMLDAFFDLRSDVRRLAYATYLANAAETFMLEGEPNEELFHLLLSAVAQVCYGSGDPRDIRDIYLVKLMDLMGFCPEVEHCLRCGKANEPAMRFVPEEGGVLCTSCAPLAGGPISAGALRIIASSRWIPLTKMGSVKLGNYRKEIEDALLGFVRYHMDTRFKALAFLDEIEN